jgi:hypothetical protein
MLEHAPEPLLASDLPQRFGVFRNDVFLPTLGDRRAMADGSAWYEGNPYNRRAPTAFADDRAAPWRVILNHSFMDRTADRIGIRERNVRRKVRRNPLVPWFKEYVMATKKPAAKKKSAKKPGKK